MILFLRDKDNKTVFELEIWEKTNESHKSNTYIEVSSVINIKEYSFLLLNQSDNKKIEMINDFEQLSELRGWLWEVYFMTKKNTPEHYGDVVKILKKDIEKIGKKYELFLVED